MPIAMSASRRALGLGSLLMYDERYDEGFADDGSGPSPSPSKRDAAINTADVLPASCSITLIVKGPSQPDELDSFNDELSSTSYLCVGWDDCGCPVVMDRSGVLRRLGPDEQVVDYEW